MADRAELVRHLSGKGIEIGALNYPLALSHNPRITGVRYVDRYGKDELLRLFPELKSVSDQIVETDIRCEIIRGLTPVADASIDFVVGCHIIEHVPDPIFFINECWRVLRPGGMLFLAVPDKDSNIDVKRPVTTLQHLIDDHAKRIQEVEDHHLEEFLRLAADQSIPTDPRERKALFDRERNRSIHIHVWDFAAFRDFLSHCMNTSSPFVLRESATLHDTERKEMLFVLEKKRWRTLLSWFGRD